MKISDNPFFNPTPILPTPPFLWEKSDTHLPIFSKLLGGANYGRPD